MNKPFGFELLRNNFDILLNILIDRVSQNANLQMHRIRQEIVS